MDTATEILVMSRKETPRPDILRALVAGHITNRQAAGALGLTIRHVQRMRQRYREEGAGGLIHRGTRAAVAAPGAGGPAPADRPADARDVCRFQ